MCDNHTRLSVFLCCRIQLPQQSYFPCFLLHKTSVEYTRLHSSIAEVLIYTVEPRIPSNDVFSKCWIVESNPVGAWVLLKLYISPSPFFRHSLFVMNKSFTLTAQNMYLSSPSRLYSTAVLWSRNHLFFSIFHDSTNRYDVGVISRSDSVLNSNFRR